MVDFPKMNGVILKFIILAALTFMSISCLAVEPTTITLKGQLQKGPTTNLAFVNGMVLSAGVGVDLTTADRTASEGFMARIVLGSNVDIKVCKNALITVSAEEGNFIPRADGVEVYKTPRILSFTCND